MKVNDIRSFFTPKNAAAAAATPTSPIVVPSRKSSKKRPQTQQSDSDVKQDSAADESEQDDHEPITKTKSGRKEKKRKAKVLSDDDDEENDNVAVKPKKAIKKNDSPPAKLLKKELSKEAKVKHADVDVNAFFGKKKNRAPEAETQTVARRESPRKKDKISDEAKGIGEVDPSSMNVQNSPTKKSNDVDESKITITSPPKQKLSEGEHKMNKSSNKLDDDKAENITQISSPSPVKSEKRRESPRKRKESSLKVAEVEMIKQSQAKMEKVDIKSTPPPTLKKESKRSSSCKETPKKQDTTKKSKKAKVLESSDNEEEFNPKEKKSKNSKSKKNNVETDTDSTPKKEVATPSTPADDALKKQRQQNYVRFLSKMSQKPKNLGKKDIPNGSPDCLQGLTFVISGVLDSLERDDCKSIIESYGGRVTSAVSRKTNYLIVGDDAGESKSKKARDLGVGIIDEDGLLKMIRDSRSGSNETDEQGSGPRDENPDDDKNKMDVEETKIIIPNKNKRGASSEVQDTTNKDPIKKNKTEQKSEEALTSADGDKKNDISSATKNTEKLKLDSKKGSESNLSSSLKKSEATNSQASFSTSNSSTTSTQMFVDKYRPTTVKQVVGQSRDNSNLHKLIKWLRNWFQNQANPSEKKKNPFYNRDPEGKSFKCALLSGAPGVGKTTCAHLAVKECGYDYFELNASDTRNKRGLVEHVRDALQSMTLSNQKLTSKHVLIMDEVDGMSGNEDRGGIQELINLIKGSKIPLICICNDRNHQKIRSLANHCFDLRFNSPTIQELKGFLSSICFKEGIKIPGDKLTEICISSDQDVRMILNQLQMINQPRASESQSLSQGSSASQASSVTTTPTTMAHMPKRDMKFGPWDVCRMVFSNEGGIRERTGLFFQDYSFGPLFVQENYPKHHSLARNKYTKLTRISNSAEAIATGDLIDSTIRRTQNWSLLPIQAIFSVCTPGYFMRSSQSGHIDFPSWLGKNSNRNKRSRLLQLLHTHLHLTVSGGQQDLNLDYLSFISKSLTGKLQVGDTTAASEVMEAYCLAREDLDSIIDLTIYPGMKNPMEKIESKTKAAFTRLVNKEMLPYSNSTLVKKSRGGGSKDDTEALLEEDGEESAAEEEEEDDASLEKDAMIKMKSKKAAPKKSTAADKKNKKK